MTTQHTIEKLSAAIDATEVTWRDGSTYSGNYVTLKKKDAIALLQLLTNEDEERTGALSSLPPQLNAGDQSHQVANAIGEASIPPMNPTEAFAALRERFGHHFKDVEP